jgi:4-aminobutyrate aminotransferase-like enzyme
MKFEEIVQRARALAARPVQRLAPGVLEKAVQSLTRRTPTSAGLADRYGRLLPRGSEHSLPLHSPYPIFMDHGEGSCVWDVDGNRYVDYILSISDGA